MTQEQPKDAGGVGGSPDKATRWEQRQHLRVLEEAVYNGWQIPAEAAASLPREVLAIATDPNASPRDRIRATELLAALPPDQAKTTLAALHATGEPATIIGHVTEGPPHLTAR